MLSYLNGEFLADESATVSVRDRGFVFGDGVYEVVRAVEGILFQWEPHIARMYDGLAGLGISAEQIDAESLREAAEHLLSENELRTCGATVYLQVTRGAAPRSHAFPEDTPDPTVYLCVAPFDAPAEVRAGGAAAIVHADLRWSRCDLKTVNLLPNTLAKQAAVEAGAFEAILVRDGIVTEGASTSVFGVQGDTVRTAPESNRILPGITRRTICELGRAAGLTVVEEAMRRDDLAQMDEIFLTGTTSDVQPIVRLDADDVGSGQPGEVSLLLQHLLADHMATETGTALPRWARRPGATPAYRT